jgi:riboflavin kinase/FMN adenylyltransferase
VITYSGKGTEIPHFNEETSVTIGNFDGVHLGHQQLIKRARQKAVEQGCKTLVLSFFPHPLWVICPKKAPPLLTPFEVKQRILERYGVDIFVAIEFSRKFANWSHERFLEEILIKRLKCLHLVIGPDFRFGKDRKGDISFLKRAANFQVEEVPPVVVKGKPVSSTRIRRLLLEHGNVSEAAELLGRHYRLFGKVKKGDQRGRKLGFPTANLEPVPRSLIPKRGTYLTKTLINGDICYTSVTNIGKNPTFGEVREYRVETHLIGFEGDLLGQEISIEFVERIRDEMKFSSPDELISQIKSDVLYAMRVCEAVY